MRLIITENIDYANSIAYAYTNKKDTDLTESRIIVGSEHSTFIWSDEPLLKGGKINPRFSERLLEKIDAFHVNKVTIALNPTRTTCLFTSLLEDALDKDITVESVTLTTLWRKDVKTAFEDSKIEVTQSRLQPSVDELAARSKISHAVAKAVSDIAGGEYQSIDATLLCLLSLLSLRDTDIGNTKFRVHAAFQIDNKKLSATSLDCFSSWECSDLIKQLGGSLELIQNPYIANIVSAESLYGALDGAEAVDVNLRNTVESLYAKRYISCPYTMSKELPANMRDNDLEILIKNCQNSLPFCDEEAVNAHNLASAPRAKQNALHAIIPLMRNPLQLEGDELAIYKYITGKYIQAASDSKTRTALLRSSGSGTLFVASIPEKLSVTKRNAKNVSASFKFQPEGTFTYYTPEELIKELTHMGLDAADVIFALLSNAASSGTLFVNNGVHLSGKGTKLLKSLPIKERDAIALYSYIESSLHACRKENNAKTPEEIFTEVTATLTSWKNSSEEQKNDSGQPYKSNPLGRPNYFPHAGPTSETNPPQITDPTSETKNANEAEIELTSESEPAKNPLDEAATVSNEGLSGHKDPNESSHQTSNEKRPNPLDCASTIEKTSPTLPFDSRQKISTNETSNQDALVAGSEGTRSNSDETELLICPFCLAEAIVREETTYSCLSCGKKLHYIMKTKVGQLTLNDKDLKKLAAHKRTSLKSISAGDEIVDRAYIVMTDDGKLGISHKSTYKCPYCDSPLKVYSWGYHCEGCSFSVPFKIYETKLTAEQIKTLISGEKTEIITDLISKDGECFNAALKAFPEGIKLFLK